MEFWKLKDLILIQFANNCTKLESRKRILPGEIGGTAGKTGEIEALQVAGVLVTVECF